LKGNPKKSLRNSKQAGLSQKLVIAINIFTRIRKFLKEKTGSKNGLHQNILIWQKKSILKNSILDLLNFIFFMNKVVNK
jgi:hypothetical protein